MLFGPWHEEVIAIVVSNDIVLSTLTLRYIMSLNGIWDLATGYVSGNQGVDEIVAMMVTTHCMESIFQGIYYPEKGVDDSGTPFDALGYDVDGTQN